MRAAGKFHLTKRRIDDMMKKEDIMGQITIIGAGPAGISAAVYAARAGHTVTVCYRDNGALFRAAKIENYYGFSEPVRGETLFENGLAQARRLGVALLCEEVVDMALADGFTVRTPRRSLAADAVILACGAAREKPSIAQLSAFEGRGVSYCATCDGFFFRAKPVAVCGAGAFALHEARALKALASSVTLLTNGAPAPKDCEFPVVTAKIETLLGEQRLAGVRFADGETLLCDGFFVALGSAGAVSFSAKLGILSERGFLLTDEHQKTNVPRLFAAGDCTGMPMQVVKAVYQGMVAGESAAAALRE